MCPRPRVMLYLSVRENEITRKHKETLVQYLCRREDGGRRTRCIETWTVNRYNVYDEVLLGRQTKLNCVYRCVLHGIENAMVQHRYGEKYRHGKLFGVTVAKKCSVGAILEFSTITSNHFFILFVFVPESHDLLSYSFYRTPGKKYGEMDSDEDFFLRWIVGFVRSWDSALHFPMGALPSSLNSWVDSRFVLRLTLGFRVVVFVAIAVVVAVVVVVVVAVSLTRRCARDTPNENRLWRSTLCTTSRWRSCPRTRPRTTNRPTYKCHRWGSARRKTSMGVNCIW